MRASPWSRAGTLHSDWARWRPSNTTKLLDSMGHPQRCPTAGEGALLLGATAKIAGPYFPAIELRLERVAVQAKHARRLAHVAVDAVQGAEHDLALEPITGLVEWQRVGLGRTGRAQRQLERQIVHADRRSVDQHHRALPHVLQLAHVAGPAIDAEDVECLRGESLGALAELVVVAADEVGHQQRDVVGPLAQGRH